MAAIHVASSQLISTSIFYRSQTTLALLSPLTVQRTFCFGRSLPLVRQKFFFSVTNFHIVVKLQIFFRNDPKTSRSDIVTLERKIHASRITQIVLLQLRVCVSRRSCISQNTDVEFLLRGNFMNSETESTSMIVLIRSKPFNLILISTWMRGRIRSVFD